MFSLLQFKMSYDTLVLSGNSTNAVFTLGALQRLYEEKILIKSNVVTYLGTSSGSIVSLLLALDFEPLDILAALCANKSYSKFSRLNLANIGIGGVLTFDPIETELENLIMSRIGYIPTMIDMKEKFNKSLFFVTFNMTTGSKEYVSHESYPTLPVIKAVRMSCTFPFIFTPFEYEGNVYIDGGISDNFPMNKAQSLGGCCLGVCTVNNCKPYTPSMNILELFLHLFYIFISSSVDNAVESPGSKIIQLKHDSSFFNFTSSNPELIKLFDCGYDECRSRQ